MEEKVVKPISNSSSPTPIVEPETSSKVEQVEQLTDVPNAKKDDVELFPWPLPDACVDVAVTSHLLEHLNPHSGDPRIVPLVQLLTEKGLITPEEITEYIGELNPGPRFMRFMDEVWRVLKPGGQFASVFPYAGSPGFWQDPTHVNGINNMTFWYFDHEEPHIGKALYAFYKPKPWKIVRQLGQKGGNLEVILEKREEKEEYFEGDPAKEHDKLAKRSLDNYIELCLSCHRRYDAGSYPMSELLII